MPAESSKQANTAKLAYYLKKHGKMPEGAGKAGAAVKSMAKMSSDQLRDYFHTKNKKGA